MCFVITHNEQLSINRKGINMFKRSFLLSLIRTLNIEAALKNTSGNSKDHISEIMELDKDSGTKHDEEFIALKEVINEMLTESMEEPFNLSIYTYGLSIATKSDEVARDILTVGPIELLGEELKKLRSYNRREMKLIKLRSGLIRNTTIINKNDLSNEEMSEFITELKEMIDKNNPVLGDEKDLMMSINASDTDTSGSD